MNRLRNVLRRKIAPHGYHIFDTRGVTHWARADALAQSVAYLQKHGWYAGHTRIK